MIGLQQRGDGRVFLGKYDLPSVQPMDDQPESIVLSKIRYIECVGVWIKSASTAVQILQRAGRFLQKAAMDVRELGTSATFDMDDVASEAERRQFLRFSKENENRIEAYSIISRFRFMVCSGSLSYQC